MSKKDIKYYLDHPDEMPTDTQEIEKLATEHIEASLKTEQLSMDDLKESEDKPKDDAEKSTEPEDKPKDPEKTEPESKAEEKPKEQEVLAKDGKHVIPYAVLAGARERAERAEALAAEQAREIEKLKAEEQAESKTTEVLSEDELEALAVDSPTLAKVLKTQQDTIKNLAGTVTELKTSAEQEKGREMAAMQAEIQVAIDGIPTMLAWQNDKDKTLWNEAARIDRVLRDSPRFSDVSFAERFKVVGKMTCEVLGIEIPEDLQDKKPETPKSDKPKLTDAEIMAAAEAKLKGKAIPKSLSDIPGGGIPAADERDRVEQMSAAELGNKMMGMTKEQLESYLSTL